MQRTEQNKAQVVELNFTIAILENHETFILWDSIKIQEIIGLFNNGL